MKLRVLAYTFVVLALVPSSLFAGVFVSSVVYEFGMSVPDGFDQNLNKTDKHTIFFFERPPKINQRQSTYIVVTYLDRLLDRENIDPKDFPDNSLEVSILEEKWQEFDIQVFRVPRKLGDTLIVSFNAQVPLKLHFLGSSMN